MDPTARNDCGVRTPKILLHTLDSNISSKLVLSRSQYDVDNATSNMSLIASGIPSPEICLAQRGRLEGFLPWQERSVTEDGYEMQQPPTFHSFLHFGCDLHLSYSSSRGPDRLVLLKLQSNACRITRMSCRLWWFKFSSCSKGMCISKWITCLSVCKESMCGLEISHQERLYLSVCIA